jgi:hypothetical protein
MYRGQHIRLESIKKQRGRSRVTCTRITIAATRSKNSRIPKNKTPLRNPLSQEEVTQMLTSTVLSYPLRGELAAKSYGYEICYEQYGVEDNTRYLQFLLELMCDLAENYIRILTWGGEAVPALQQLASNNNHALHKIAPHLLRDIASETTQRLRFQAGFLYCPRCLTHYEERKIKLSWWQTITYLGCRACGQSREVLSGEQLVAMLDGDIGLKTYKRNGNLHVNWLEHRQMFDFDKIEIRHATDEDVERFAVQVGNDTDPVRKPRYKKMRCVVSPECELSKNTMRILEQMFGEVAVMDHADA